MIDELLRHELLREESHVCGKHFSPSLLCCSHATNEVCQDFRGSAGEACSLVSLSLMAVLLQTADSLDSQTCHGM
jgi:hypothetical protein